MTEDRSSNLRPGDGSTAPATCLYCGESITFKRGRGWHHPEGGSIVQTCRKCGWKGAPPLPAVKCPRCQSTSVYNDHAASPKWPSTAEEEPAG